MTRLAIVALFILSLGVAQAAPPSPDPATLVVAPEQVARARELVRQLGSTVFRERDQAARELAGMGRAALPALDASRNDSDPEIRMRVGALLPRAEADELQARIDTFLADADARFVHDLPGYRQFRIAAGDDPDARALFTAILKDRSNYTLLLALRGVPAVRVPTLSAAVGSVAFAGIERPTTPDLALALAARRNELQTRANRPILVGGIHRPYAPDLPDIALLMLAESLASESKAAFNPFQVQLTNFLYQDPVRRAASGQGKHGAPFRRLVIHWMDTRDDFNGVNNAMNLAMNLQLGNQEVAKYAARLLTVDGTQPWSRANAVTMLARTDSKGHLPAIIGLFADTELVVRGGPNNPQPDIEVRDVALAMAAMMTGQSPKDYGLDLANSQSSMKYQYTNYRFTDDSDTKAEAKRAAAFAKWKDFELTLHAAAVGVPGAVPVVTAKPTPAREAKEAKDGAAEQAPGK